jgi:integrase
VFEDEELPDPLPAYRALRIALPSGRAYWSVIDACYERHDAADRFLFDLRFGRDRAESTTRVYAGELARFLNWSVGRGLDGAAKDLSRFMLYVRSTPISRPGSSRGRTPGANRINHVLAVTREFYKHAVLAGAVGPEVLTLLYEVADDRFLPSELRGEAGGLAYRARPRHRLRAERDASAKVAAQEEWEALLRAASSWRDRFLLVLLWFTGLRIGEALGLRRADLHLAESSVGLGCQIVGPHVHVCRRDNVNRASAKSRRDRAVPAVNVVLVFYEA